MPLLVKPFMAPIRKETVVVEHEPSEGWGQDLNLACNYTDQGGFTSISSPDLSNILTWSVLASLSHTGDNSLSNYSMEEFAAFSNAYIPNLILGKSEKFEDAYSFPGFHPLPIIRGVFGDLFV